MNQDEISSLYNFLLHTGEGNLKQMLVDGKNMTDGHLRLLLKIVKNCKEDQFQSCLEKAEFPKIKMSAGEIVIRERFWTNCKIAFESRGLLSPETPKAAA